LAELCVGPKLGIFIRLNDVCIEEESITVAMQIAMARVPVLFKKVVRICELGDTRKYLLKNGFFWDVTPCGSCKNRRFGGT
jgi:hypothetical protein